MNIYRDYSDLKASRPVVTLGMFDGVHLGHRHLLNRVREVAAERGGESVAITFEPHPRVVLSDQTSSLRFLTSLEEKISLLSETGIDHLLVLPFTTEFSQISACDFIGEVLVKGIGVNHLVVGFDHQFGYRAGGDSITVSECAGKYGFTMERVEALMDNDKSVSSTTIRDSLVSGNLAEANRLLGYDYFLQGSVIEGKRIGRSIGYPTANLEPNYSFKLIPRNGVYAVEVVLEERLYKAMLYIGTRPTLDGADAVVSIEANLFDYHGDMYGKDIRIYFRKRLRDDIKFENKEMLREQIGIDKENTLKVLGESRHTI